MSSRSEQVAALRRILSDRQMTQLTLAGEIGISTGGLSEFLSREKGGDYVIAKITDYLIHCDTSSKTDTDAQTENTTQHDQDEELWIENMRNIMMQDVALRVSSALAHEIGISNNAMTKFINEKNAPWGALQRIQRWCENTLKHGNTNHISSSNFVDGHVSSTDSEDESETSETPETPETTKSEFLIHIDQITMTQEDYQNAVDGHVYVMGDLVSHRVKIGRTKDIFSRMRNLGQGNPDLHVALLMRTRHNVFAETQLKRLLNNSKYPSRELRNVPSRNVPSDSCATEWYSVQLEDVRKMVFDVCVHTDQRMREFDVLQTKP